MLPCDFLAEFARELRYPCNVRRVLFLVLAVSISCSNSKQSSKLPASNPPPTTFFTAELTDSTFRTANHFLASIEMQISGEPFAQLLGLNLAGYDRFNTTPDLYFDPGTGRPSVDPLGYSTRHRVLRVLEAADEQHLVRVGRRALARSTARCSTRSKLDRRRRRGAARQSRPARSPSPANAGGPPGANFVVSPAPDDNPLNVYGWPGYWPAFAEFQRFDPDDQPVDERQQAASAASPPATPARAPARR